MFKSGLEPYGGRGTTAEELGLAVEDWVRRGLISPADAEEVRRDFIETRRQHINVIPGFQLIRPWSKAEVLEAEHAGTLEGDLIASYREAVATWGDAL